MHSLFNENIEAIINLHRKTGLDHEIFSNIKGCTLVEYCFDLITKREIYLLINKTCQYF